MEGNTNTNSETPNDVVIKNTFRAVNPKIGSTGFRTHISRYDALREPSVRRIAEEFLINSRLRRGDAEMGVSVKKYLMEPTTTMLLSQLGQEGRLGSHSFSLPASVELQISLSEVIQRRRSVRRYTGDAMSLTYLATIIRAACGITMGRSTDSDGIPSSAFRSTPSGGGLYPIDLYIAALNVEDLPRGFYVYDPLQDQLWQTGEEEQVNALLDSLALKGQSISEHQANVFCLMVGRPWRSMRKYGDRGMRYVFLEAGAMAEHINLTAVALGLGCVHCGSFYDDEAHEAMDIDGLYEALIHSVVIGWPE